MKNRLTSPLGFVAMAFLLATAVTSTASIEDMTKTKVVRIKGSARFTTGTGAWQPLKVGDILTSGTVLQTAADSRVDLVLGDPKAMAGSAKVGLPFGAAGPGSSSGGGAGPSSVDQNFIRLMENTVMSIDKLTATDTGADIVTDTQLDLRAGRIFGTVKKLSAGSRYEVKIPNGVAGVRGTIYTLTALGDCSVYEGSIAMALTDSSGEVTTRIINAMQKYNALEDILSDLSAQGQSEMRLLASASQPPRRGSYPYPLPQPRRVDRPYLPPDEGWNGPPSPTTP